MRRRRKRKAVWVERRRGIGEIEVIRRENEFDVVPTQEKGVVYDKREGGGKTERIFFFSSND